MCLRDLSLHSDNYEREIMSCMVTDVSKESKSSSSTRKIVYDAVSLNALRIHPLYTKWDLTFSAIFDMCSTNSQRDFLFLLMQNVFSRKDTEWLILYVCHFSCPNAQTGARFESQSWRYRRRRWRVFWVQGACQPLGLQSCLEAQCKYVLLPISH